MLPQVLRLAQGVNVTSRFTILNGEHLSLSGIIVRLVGLRGEFDTPCKGSCT
jgi:hypothetical protein